MDVETCVTLWYFLKQWAGLENWAMNMHFKPILILDLFL